jgi:hypothetical protein
MYDWLKQYEALWTHQVDRIKQRAERMQREADARKDAPPEPSGPGPRVARDA